MIAERWSPHRKAALLLALDYDLLTSEEVTSRFELSSEELATWRRDLAAYGVGGLRSTRVQIYQEHRRVPGRQSDGQ